MSLPKLVRDKIPELIVNSGQSPVFEPAGNNELAYFLFAKLDEEIGEFKEDPSVEEAADIYEAFLALCENFNMSIEEILSAARDKRSVKGAFKKAFILREINQ